MTLRKPRLFLTDLVLVKFGINELFIYMLNSDSSGFGKIIYICNDLWQQSAGFLSCHIKYYWYIFPIWALRERCAWYCCRHPTSWPGGWTQPFLKNTLKHEWLFWFDPCMWRWLENIWSWPSNTHEFLWGCSETVITSLMYPWLVRITNLKKPTK